MSKEDPEDFDIDDPPAPNPFVQYTPYVPPKNLISRTAFQPDVIIRLKEQFLSFLAETGSVEDACAHIGVEKTTPFQWRLKDEEFGEAWDRTRREICLPMLEEQIFLRATKGAKVAPGDPILMMFLAKAWKPSMYDDKLRIADAAPSITINMVDTNGTTIVGNNETKTIDIERKHALPEGPKGPDKS
jgi:hypothetical protein